MPKINLGSNSDIAELVARLPAKFSSSLPPSGGLVRDVAPAFRNLNAATFGHAYMSNVQDISGSMTRAIATTTGWVQDEIPVLKDMIGTLLEPIAEDVAAAMFGAIEAALPDAIEELGSAIQSGLSGYPIIGTIVSAGVMLWKGLRDLSKHDWIHGVKAETIALGYDKAWDEQATNAAISLLASRAWTNVFAPPTGKMSWKTIAYTSSGEADGVAWGNLGADPDDAWGIVPGVASIAGYWQTPRLRPRSTHWARAGEIVSQVQLLPSLNTIGSLIWTNAQRPTPQLGAIDYIGLKSKWADYGEEVRAFWRHEGGFDATTDDAWPHRKGNRGDWFANQVREAFSWIGEDGTIKYRIKLTDVSPQWRVGWLDYLARGMIEKAWIRSVQSLTTEAVAYVADDAPLLVGDPGLRPVAEKFRKLLLTSPRRAYIDISLVPKGEYHDALAKALEGVQLKKQRQCPPGMKNSAVGGFDHCVIDMGHGMDGTVLEPPAPPVPPKGPGGGGGAAAVAIAVGVLLAAGGYALVRRR